MNWIQKHLELGLLVLVMALAAVLRFWNCFEIPFTYDEYSSYFRASQDSFSKVLEVGILTDAHPAFLHSFLYLWLKLAGDSIFLIKFPFIVASLGAVWLTYVLGKRWFGTNAALLAASLLAVTEFPLMYSQIARPYSIGLFAAMAMFWQWDNFIKNPSTREALFLALILGAGAYVHHFVALHGLILLALAFYYLLPADRNKLLLVIGVGFAFYLPQLMITWEQLKFKGIGTILPPVELSFIGHHLSYLANFDWLLGLVMLFILGISFSHWKKGNTSLRWALLVVWGLPLVAGLSYSFWVAPIIQDRVLIFGLPALCILISSGLQWITPKIGRAIVVLTCVVGTFSTLQTRAYYKLFYTDDFSNVASLAFEGAPEKTTKLLAYHPPILEFQANRQGFDLGEIVNPDSSWSFQDLRNVILNDKSENFAFGWTTQYYLPPFETMALLRERYVSLNKRRSFNHGDFQLWSDRGEEYSPNFSSSLSLLDAADGWHFNSAMLSSDSTSNFLQVGPEDEWSLEYSKPLDDLTSCKNAVVFTSVELSSACGESLLVMEIVGPGGQISWRGIEFNNFGSDEGKRWIHLATPLSEISHLPEGSIMKTFVWNKGACEIQIFNAEVWIDEGLQFMYSLDHPF